MAEKKLKNYCRTCNRETNHDVIGINSEVGNPDEYNYKLEHSIVKCCGCEAVSFRKAFHDYENVFQIDEDEWDYDITVDIYPKKTKSHIDVSNAPEVVRSIYNETCNAFSDGSHTLAGIGFRATIEAICNDQEIVGKELYTRINNLATKGLISKKDSIRLHSIRFLGNDAAHDIKKPTLKNLEAALTIIEHLLTTIYLIDSETKGKLQEVIDDYRCFEKMLLEKINYLKPADELPIQKIFGADARLLAGSTRSFEKQLIIAISTGRFTKLAVGKKVKIQNSKEELQNFVVIAPVSV